MNKSALYDNLVNYLPEEQKPFKNTPAYNALCEALFEYLAAEPEDKEEKKVIMQHAKEVFDHMTATVQAPKKQPEGVFKGLKEELLQ